MKDIWTKNITHSNTIWWKSVSLVILFRYTPVVNEIKSWKLDKCNDNNSQLVLAFLVSLQQQIEVIGTVFLRAEIYVYL
jgi:hypothetical protein